MVATLTDLHEWDATMKKHFSTMIEYSGNHLTHLTDCGNCLTGGEFRK
jgi:hypothetical protein